MSSFSRIKVALAVATGAVLSMTSTDARASEWTEIAQLEAGLNPTDMAVDGQRILVTAFALDTSNFFAPVLPRVQYSTNGGASFRAIEGSVGSAAGQTTPSAAAFAGPVLVFAQGSSVYRSADRGATWESAEAPGTLLALHFASETTGVGVGEGGVIARTSDGGASWQGVTSPTTVDLRGMFWLDGLRGWAWGETEERSGGLGEPEVVTVGAGALIATSDGGASWIMAHSLDGVLVGPAYFRSPQEGWLATATRTSDSGMAARAALFSTKDGGGTLEGIVLPGAVGQISGPFGSSEDIEISYVRGMRWASANEGHLLAIAHLFDSEQGGSGGGGTSTTQRVSGFRIIDMLTTDGGNSWSHINLGTLTAGLSGVQGPNDGEILRAHFQDFYAGTLLGADGRVWRGAVTCSDSDPCVTGFVCERTTCVPTADSGGGTGGAGDGGGRPGVGDPDAGLGAIGEYDDVGRPVRRPPSGDGAATGKNGGCSTLSARATGGHWLAMALLCGAALVRRSQGARQR